VAGRIVSIQFGRGDGSIRLADRRDVYFHRADLEDGTGFNALKVGDAVTFELLDDRISGARAVRVTKRTTR
jgi:cold shock CspA family protein